MSRKSGQLVCQHLEGISRKALEDYQAIIRDYVRHRHGVYALYRGDRLYYVGLASDLRTRLKHHLRDRHANTWDRFSIYITIGDHHLRELEALVLRIASPKGNRQRGKLPRSEDLHRRFRKDIRCNQQEELLGLFPALASRVAEHDGKPALIVRQGRIPALASYATKPFKIRMRYKGKWIAAVVRRGGRIHCRGKLFTSPSMAGTHAMNRTAVNGWDKWLYQRAPGDWVRLSELRRR